MLVYLFWMMGDKERKVEFVVCHIMIYRNNFFAMCTKFDIMSPTLFRANESK